MSSIIQGGRHVGAGALPAWVAMAGGQSVGLKAEPYGARKARVVDGLMRWEPCSDASEWPRLLTPA